VNYKGVSSSLMSTKRPSKIRFLPVCWVVPPSQSRAQSGRDYAK